MFINMSNTWCSLVDSLKTKSTSYVFSVNHEAYQSVYISDNGVVFEELLAQMCIKYIFLSGIHEGSNGLSYSGAAFVVVQHVVMRKEIPFGRVAW